MKNKNRCRLCLNQNFDGIYDTIPLFDKKGNIVSKALIQLILKCLDLSISPKYLSSNCVCQDCYDKLNDFENFYQFVHLQQRTLENEFLEVLCKESVVESLGTTEQIANDPLEHTKDVEIKVEKNEAEIFDSNEAKNPTKNSDGKIIAAEINNENDRNIYNDFDDTTCIEIKEENTNKKTNRKRKAIISELIKNEENNPLIKVKEKNTKNRKKPAVLVVNKNDKGNLIENRCTETKEKDESEDDDKNVGHLYENPLTEGENEVTNTGVKRTKKSKISEKFGDLHENVKDYKCRICRKIYKTKPGLERHMVTHGENLDRFCDNCKILLSDVEALKTHKLKTSCKQRVDCPQCEMSFANNSTMRVHISSVHDNFSPHVCEHCGKMFKRSNILKKHILESHQGLVEKPVQCKVCHSWLKHRDSLRKHMARHSMKESTCPHCQRKFPSIFHLRRHLYYSHQTSKSHACKFCDKTFRFAKGLQEHLAMHTGIKLYTCIHCCKEFRYKAYLYTHIKRTHKEEWLRAQLERSHNPNVEKSLENKPK